MKNLPGRSAVLAWCSVAASCGGSDLGSDGPAVVTRDSAGVEIVENRQPAWAEGEGWRVAPDPLVSVGTREGEDPYVFSYVADAVLLPDGGVAVLDRNVAEIRLFGPDGAHRATGGGPGEGPGELRFPDRIIVVRGDSLLVTQGYPTRLTLFTPSGTFGRAWTVENVGAIGAVAAGGLELLGLHQEIGDRYDGYERATAHVLHVAPSGAVDTLASFPGYDGSFRREGNAVVGERVPFGRAGLAAFGPDRFHVGNGDTWDVASHALEDGTLLRRTRLDVETRPITDEAWERDWEAYLGSLSADFLERRGDAVRESRERAHRLATMPAYDHLLPDPSGHLWVRRYAPPWEPSIRWDVLDPSGRWLGIVTLPEELDVLEIGRDRILGTTRDELGVMTVRVHELHR